MQGKLAQLGPGRRIGISWHTSNTQDGPVRNIPLAQWLPILKLAGCHFVSLQHHVAPHEVAEFCAASGVRIHTSFVPDPVADTEGLTALIASMDEVITIDNSNVHLAGALGVPTTLLLPRGCNFRWPEQEDGGTLWYRNVRLERQAEPMHWIPVIDRVAAGLRSRLTGNSE